MLLNKCSFLCQNKTMKALVIKQFGSPDNFQEIDLPILEIRPHSVLIRVAATSVNPLDFKIRQGVAQDIAPNFPAILHGDVAGRSCWRRVRSLPSRR